jgi:hypothetical protein
MTFKTSYLTYRHVGEYVEDFLKKYHSSLQLPINSGYNCHTQCLVVDKRDIPYQSHQHGLGQITGLRFIFDDMSEEKNLINRRKYTSAISAKDQK